MRMHMKSIQENHNQSKKKRMLVTIISCAIVVVLVSCLSLFAETKSPQYEKAGKRDPFIPYVTSDGQLINIGTQQKEFSLKLEGIIYEEGGQSMVIVNGEVLKENDTIADAKIVEIRKNSVVYMKDGKLFVAKNEE